MLPAQVHKIIGDPNYMVESDAALLLEQIRKYECGQSILELGFMCGTSTCYYAGIAEEMGGRVTSVDVEESADYNPSAEQQLDMIGLRHLVTIHREPTCYTWRLMRFLQENPRPVFDWVHIDGAHKWTEDACAVFLVEKLLRPGGCILLDNINFSFGNPGRKSERIERCASRYTDEEMYTKQIRNVWELVLWEHPSFKEFHEFDVQDGWGYGLAVKG